MRDQQLVFENSAPTGTLMTPPIANNSAENTHSELDTRTNQTTVEGWLGTTDTNADSQGQVRKRGPRHKPRRPTLREETPTVKPPIANSSAENTHSELDTRTNQTTVEGWLGTTDTNADSQGQVRKRGPRHS